MLSSYIWQSTLYIIVYQIRFGFKNYMDICFWYDSWQKQTCMYIIIHNVHLHLCTYIITCMQYVNYIKCVHVHDCCMWSYFLVVTFNFIIAWDKRGIRAPQCAGVQQVIIQYNVCTCMYMYTKYLYIMFVDEVCDSLWICT